MAETKLTPDMLTKHGLDRVWGKVTDNFEPQVEGKGLSTNDFTNEMKSSLLAMQDRIQLGADDSFIAKGSVDFADLPTTGNEVGHVYNINDAFTANEAFIASEQGKDLPAGTNVVYTSEGWDILGGTYDFSEFMMKEDIKPIDNDTITAACVLTEATPAV